MPRIRIACLFGDLKPSPAKAAALVIVVALLLAAAYGFVRRGEPELEVEPLRITLPPLTPPPKVQPQRLLPVSPQDARAINARVPFVAGKLKPAEPFRYEQDAESRSRAVDCLAAAAWYEAGDDGAGARSVIQVVLNRARHPAFPASICGVVFQGSERRTGCQFTFTCDGSLARLPSQASWNRARALAEQAMSGLVDRRVGQATHYHADYVVPYWSSSLDKIARVGAHIFYRWRGYWGGPRAFHRPLSKSEPAIEKLALISSAHLSRDVGEALVVLEPSPDDAPVTAVTPLPTPIRLAGVREKSLRGALVRGQVSDLFFIQLVPGSFPGNYSTAALAICKGRARCTVLGWRDPQRMATAFPLSAISDRALTFYYHRDDKGDERALWNCAQVERANKAQCLPAETAGPGGLSL